MRTLDPAAQELFLLLLLRLQLGHVITSVLACRKQPGGGGKVPSNYKKSDLIRGSECLLAAHPLFLARKGGEKNYI